MPLAGASMPGGGGIVITLSLTQSAIGSGEHSRSAVHCAQSVG
jgi:hypothetical protein